MKKCIFFAGAFLASTVLFAQSDAKFGLKGGVNIANTHNNSGNNTTNLKVGLNVGALAHIHLTPKFALQPELMYSSQGNKYTTSSLTEHQLNLNYINVPVLLQYMFDNGFRFQTGPQLGLLIDVNDKVNGKKTSGIVTSADFKKTDVAWSVGLGYLSYSGFGIDARYNFGLTDINNDPAIDVKLRNNVAQIGVFYLFDHNHKSKSR